MGNKFVEIGGLPKKLDEFVKEKYNEINNVIDSASLGGDTSDKNFEKTIKNYIKNAKKEKIDYKNKKSSLELFLSIDMLGYLLKNRNESTSFEDRNIDYKLYMMENKLDFNYITKKLRESGQLMTKTHMEFMRAALYNDESNKEELKDLILLQPSDSYKKISIRDIEEEMSRDKIQSSGEKVFAIPMLKDNNHWVLKCGKVNFENRKLEMFDVDSPKDGKGIYTIEAMKMLVSEGYDDLRRLHDKDVEEFSELDKVVKKPSSPTVTEGEIKQPNNKDQSVVSQADNKIEGNDHKVIPERERKPEKQIKAPVEDLGFGLSGLIDQAIGEESSIDLGEVDQDLLQKLEQPERVLSQKSEQPKQALLQGLEQQEQASLEKSGQSEQTLSQKPEQTKQIFLQEPALHGDTQTMDQYKNSGSEKNAIRKGKYIKMEDDSVQPVVDIDSYGYAKIDIKKIRESILKDLQDETDQKLEQDKTISQGDSRTRVSNESSSTNKSAIVKDFTPLVNDICNNAVEKLANNKSESVICPTQGATKAVGVKRIIGVVAKIGDKEYNKQDIAKIQKLYAKYEISCMNDAVYHKEGSNEVVKSPMHFGSTKTEVDKNNKYKTLILEKNEALGAGYSLQFSGIPLNMSYAVLVKAMRRDLPAFMEAILKGGEYPDSFKEFKGLKLHVSVLKNGKEVSAEKPKEKSLEKFFECIGENKNNFMKALQETYKKTQYKFKANNSMQKVVEPVKETMSKPGKHVEDLSDRRQKTIEMKDTQHHDNNIW